VNSPQTRKPYKAKSLSGAQARVRLLMRRIDRYEELLDQMKYERLMLAKLSSKEPMFYNPLDVWQAEAIRDRVLKNNT